MRGLTAALGAALAFLPLTIGAHADTAGCRPKVAEVIAKAEAQASDLIGREYTGDAAQAGIRLYNAIPPVSHTAGDRFFVFFEPGNPDASLLIAKGECLVDGAKVGISAALRLMRAIGHREVAPSPAPAQPPEDVTPGESGGTSI
jgi:hypothetical protein